MLGAEIGTSLMAVVHSFDLSWLSPLLIFVGIVLFKSNEKSTDGRIGTVAIGFGLITLGLQHIIAATAPIIAAPSIRGLIIGVPNDVLLHIVVGALLTLACYQSGTFPVECCATDRIFTAPESQLLNKLYDQKT